ncbi:MAG TPA: hypothetical protein VGB97_03320 [Candidatus Paceibacterota bacterium]|jgi:hypothetical protein
MQDKGQNREVRTTRNASDFDTFVLDKSIFSNIFDKDIRRVYIYKKAERLAKAIHLIAPAFRHSPALRDRLDQVSVGLVDAAIEPPSSTRDQLSRELLALSSVLSIAESSGLLSSMNAELIAREAHTLLQEVASYEAPRLFLEEAPTLAMLAKDMASENARESRVPERTAKPVLAPKSAPATRQPKGQVSDKTNSRRDAIVSILKSKGPSYIKDISTVIRDVSEKTVQRELQALVESGEVTRTGERRWTTYTLANA